MWMPNSKCSTRSAERVSGSLAGKGDQRTGKCILHSSLRCTIQWVMVRMVALHSRDRAVLMTCLIEPPPRTHLAIPQTVPSWEIIVSAGWAIFCCYSHRWCHLSWTQIYTVYRSAGWWVQEHGLGISPSSSKGLLAGFWCGRGHHMAGRSKHFDLKGNDAPLTI